MSPKKARDKAWKKMLKQSKESDKNTMGGIPFFFREEDRFSTLAKEYIEDPVRKRIWNAGLGEYLSDNRHVLEYEEALAEIIKKYLDIAKKQQEE